MSIQFGKLEKEMIAARNQKHLDLAKRLGLAKRLLILHHILMQQKLWMI